MRQFYHCVSWLCSVNECQEDQQWMACAEMSIQAENACQRGGYDPSGHLAHGVVAFERHQFQLGEMWPLGGSYMTATNAENRTRAWAKSEDIHEGWG